MLASVNYNWKFIAVLHTTSCLDVFPYVERISRKYPYSPPPPPPTPTPFRSMALNETPLLKEFVQCIVIFWKPIICRDSASFNDLWVLKYFIFANCPVGQISFNGQDGLYSSKPVSGKLLKSTCSEIHVVWTVLWQSRVHGLEAGQDTKETLIFDNFFFLCNQRPK